ncbi:MAG: hypothetical protein J6T10_29280 [Methanobrevibacter sp.]|nr:hypothetical protein [Methanobrevibacter sp.]
MRDKLRKKYQLNANKLVKEVNKAIEADFLWRGRFVFHIMDSNFERFKDGSGGILYVILRGYDKKTNYYKDYILDYAPYFQFIEWDLWQITNKFITEDTDTWKKGNNPFNDNKIDYTKVKIDDNIWNFKYYPYKQF